MDEPVSDQFRADSDAEQLLLDWFKWWEEDDSSPAKMPNALHVKTAVYFATKS